ncbi:CsxC family protein [Bacillus sp. J33]|uniref:CsxC family protein n=1 Tax=Bacillus sp. J33 TaxID=935836 RepID=UPI00068806F3|nr:hypothetical protein [Bacillus sp. J33]
MSETHKDNCLSESKAVTYQCECQNCHEHFPHISIGKIIAKVPVVLAELTAQINIDAIIKFPEPVLEIKDIKKTVKLTQCRLLLPTNKLFIKGFVRKNIQYASPCPDIEMHSEKSVASDLHSYTVDIPFQSVEEIKQFLTLPTMPEMTDRTEFDFFVSKPVHQKHSDTQELQLKDNSQYHQESIQHYNELPYCELISSRIVEWDEAIDKQPLPKHAPLGETLFTRVEEKMVLDLTLKVLQKQQIRVSSTTNDNDDCFHHCE